MTPKGIARLDRWIGTPACFLFTGMSWFGRLFRRRRTDPPQKILFVKLIEMGSTVLASQAFEEATKLVGKENLYILVFEENRFIVDVLPYFQPENVITVKRTNLFAFAWGLAKAMRHARREQIDTAIDMEGLTRSSAIITWLSGASRRVGYYNFTSEGPFRGRLFTDELNYTFQHHTSKAFLALVRALRCPPDGVPLQKVAVDDPFTPPAFEPDPEDVRHVRELLGPEPGRVVLLNPNCSDLLPLRRWDTERFVALGRRLLEHSDDIRIGVTGAPGEREAAEAIATAIGPPERVRCLAGRTTLRQLLALYCVSDVLVSNDSGPVHFASLTPVHVVALFGPETPALYAPLGENSTVICADLACSPCVNILNHRFSPCTDNVCMQAIGVEQVFDATVAALASP